MIDVFLSVTVFSIVEFYQSMIDCLFCFVTCLVRDKIRRGEENDDQDKRLYRYKRTKDREITGERENLQIEIVYLVSIYMGDLSLWRVLHEVIFCFLYVSSSIYRSYSPNDVVCMPICTVGNLVRK
jgi:hypothetical protein